jgi:hypothetical protein
VQGDTSKGGHKQNSPINRKKTLIALDEILCIIRQTLGLIAFFVNRPDENS